MSADSEAFKVIQTVPGLSPAEQQYALSVFRGEGFYGLGWGNPSTLTITESAKYGIDPKAGIGSNNWGAEQGAGTAGSFPHVDFGWMIPDADGKPSQKHWQGSGPKVWGSYIGRYKRYSTPTEGASGAAKILFKPNLREALRTGIYKGQQVGPIRAAVFTQHDNRYFQLDPEKYLASVKRNYDILSAALKWPRLLDLVENPPLVTSGSGSESLEPSAQSCGSPPLPEAGFLRWQKYSVPGVQDEQKK